MRKLARVMLAGLALAGCGAQDAPPAPGAAEPADVYAAGPHAVEQLLLAEGEEGNPKEVRLFVPRTAGRYPLLQFQHGFTSDVDSYTELLALLASHGFVIAAPQMYVGDPSSAPSVPAETQDAVAVLGWVKANVNGVIARRLPSPAVSAEPASTGLFGHSRGGQVAWRMLVDFPLPYAARAIAGVDPVDGDAPPFPPGQTGELVTDDDPGGFALPFASLVLGMGRGGEGVPGFECAPVIRNYTLFFDASAAPRYELVATDYGHSDMLNGETPEAVCTGDTSMTRHRVRSFVSGALAAYFGQVLEGRDLGAFLREPARAPVAATGRYEE